MELSQELNPSPSAYIASSGNSYFKGGKVSIGTEDTNGKLQITSSGDTEVYIEETGVGRAANLHLKNPVRTWRMGADSIPDLFYLGTESSQYMLNITSA